MTGDRVATAVLELTTEAGNIKTTLTDLQKQLAGIRQRFDEADKDASSFSGRLGGVVSQVGAMTAGFISAQAVMGGVRAVFNFAKDAAIGMNASLEKSELQFTTLMGDSDRAKKHVADLFQFAKNTPFETGPIIAASKHMQTFGGDSLNTMDNLTLLGDAAAATNAPIEDLGFWVGRMFASLKGGQPIGEATMRLMELGVITPGVRSQMEALASSAGGGEKAFGVFQESLGRFSGAMVAQANTWDGLMSSISDSINITLAQALRPFFDATKQGAQMLLQVLGSEGTQKVFDGVREKLTATFGGDGQGMVKGLASGLLTFASAGITIAEVVVKAFMWVDAGLMTIMTGVTGLVGTVVSGIDGIVTVASKVPGIGSKFDGVKAAVHDTNLQLQAMRQSYADSAVDSFLAAKGQSAFSTVMGAARDVIAGMQTELKKATVATTDQAKAVAGATPGQEQDLDLLKEKQKALKSVTEALTGLTQDMARAQRSGTPFSEMLTEFGPKAVKVAEDAKRMGVSISEAVATMANSQQFAEWDELWTKLWLDSNAGAQKALGEMTKTLDEFTKHKTESITAALTAERAASEQFAVGERALVMQALEFKVAAAKRGHASSVEVDQLERQLSSARLEASISDAQREFTEKTRALDRTTEMGRKAYGTMEKAHKATVTKMVNDWEEGERVRTASTATWTETFTAVIGKIPSLVQQAMTGGGGMGGAMGAIASAFGEAGIGKLFSDKGAVGKVMGKGLTKLFGDSVGGALSAALPGIGAALGSLMGPLMTKIGGGLKSLFGIGVNEEIKKANVEIEKVFDTMIAGHGTLDATEEAFNRVGLSIKANLGHQGPEGLKATNALMAEFEARTKAVQKATEQAVTGFGAVVTEMAKPWLELGDAIDAAYKKTADAEGAYRTAAADIRTSADELATLRSAYEAASDAEQALYRQQWADAQVAKQQLADLGTQAVATFAAALISTGSYSEALKQVSPSLASLHKAYKSLGLDVEDVALKHLLLQSTVQEANPALITAIGGLSGSMQGLAQLGLLNVDTFGAMQRTGMEMYARLQAAVSAAGGESRDALLPMQTYLQQAAVQANLLGIPLDENTSMLIEQSKELGIWKDAGKSANDLLIEGMSAVVAKLDELITRISGVTTGILNIPDRTVRIGFELGEFPEIPTLGDAGVHYMDSGGFGVTTRPTLFMASEDGQREEFAFSGQGRSFSTGGGVDTRALEGKFDRLERTLTSVIPAMVEMAARHGAQTAGRRA